MLIPSRLPLTAEEHAAVERLIAKHGHGSLTRCDPGETGPVLVHIGDDTWEVDAAGRARKQRKGR